MATKLYFRDAATDVGGTLPSGEQSAAAPTITGTGATTLRSLSTTIGSAQATLTYSASVSAAATNGLHGMFVSRPLVGSGTIGGGSIVLNVAERESSNNANFWINSIVAYVWRPGTGAKVGNIRDAAGTSLGGSEPSVNS